MSRGRQPCLYLQFLLFVFAGWVNRHQQAVIEYLQAENQSLREQLGKKRIRWTDAQRRRLAEKARAIGKSALAALGKVVTPDNGSRKRGPGRPRRKPDIAKLVIRMAKENPSWGYSRIRGALFNLGHDIARNTIKAILKERGIEPAPERGPPYELAHDRDPLYTKAFRAMLKDSGINIVRLPARSRNLNCYAERWIKSLREECLKRIIPLSVKHLRQTIASYVEHYHQERSHQGLANRLIEARAANTNGGRGRIRRRERVGGLLNFYYRDVA